MAASIGFRCEFDSGPALRFAGVSPRRHVTRQGVMVPRRDVPARPRFADRAQLRVALRRSGLSDLGIQQALQGSIVSSPSDRVAIARILAAIAVLPAHHALEVYDWPGDYAVKRPGEAEVRRGD